MTKKILVIFFVFVHSLILSDSIKYTKHNLSAPGHGMTNSKNTSRICIFCHTSHHGVSSAPLWSRGETKVIYTLYDSSTLYSKPDQPDGATKLCLSCHDGTIALANAFTNKGDNKSALGSESRISPSSSSLLGMDISDDHPVSFDSSMAVSGSPELRHPLSGDRVKYDTNGRVQCTTCHDPHRNVYQKFLVKNNINAAICKTCHSLTGFNGVSVHDNSTKIWNGMNENPWPHTDYSSVRENSCLNCHRTHNAKGKERLLSSDMEENVCLVCHDGSVGKNLKALLVKTSGHPVTSYQGIHDPTEDILTAQIHCECLDCHNPHRINIAKSNAPYISGRLAGVSGMSITGSLKKQATYQFEVCLKCHGQDKYRVTTSIVRVLDTANLRIAISPSNKSYHAIAAQGKSNWVPSLIPPYTTSSRLYCTDCHNNDSSGSIAGSEPAGPHGSRYQYILEKRYVTVDHTPWSEGNYDLCFKCHNPFTLFDSSVSSFSGHKRHVKDNSTPCSICHDPHGSPGYIRLLNFDTSAVFPNENGTIKFEIIGNKGYCYLQCHGKNHQPKEYTRK